MSGYRKVVPILAMVLSLLATATPARGQATDWKQIPIPPLHSFHPQEPRRIELPNGMVIFLQEDHELPLIRGSARIRGGSREEPADKVGLVDIYEQVWRTGGTKSKTGDELDDFLEARAARVESSGGLDSTGISLDCLKGNFDEVFAVFVELLRDPAFREDKIPLAKRQLTTDIARRNDEAAGIAGREARMLVYGKTSPYARIEEYSTVAAVTREDLMNWHQTYVHPNNLILGLVGDFDSQAMEAKLREAFASLPKGPAFNKLEAAISQAKPGVYLVPKEDVNQSAIRMVDLGTTRDNPDYYAIEVFNQLFGGSFSSRLFSDIRSKKGLAYNVGGGIGTAYDHPGVFALSMGTKSATTVAAIEALEEELDGLKKNPPTANELKTAKDAILNSFIFSFDSKAKVLSERMAYEFYGYPSDFLERYPTGIEKVTLADVSRVIDRYVHKDRLSILVVGKPAEFDRPLASLGPVTTLDITIPSAGGETKAAASASNSQGKALLAKVTEALGGMEKVRLVKSIRQKVIVLANTPQGEMSIEAEQVTVFPDRMWQKLSTPMGEMIMVFSPDAAFMESPNGIREIPPSRKEDALKELKRDPFFVVQHADDPRFTFTAAGTEKIGDVEAEILDVAAEGAHVRWFVDPKNGRIMRAQSQSMGPDGPSESVVDYSDWRTVDGVTLPFKESQSRDGQVENSIEVRELTINPTVDPKIFAKPAAQQP